MIIDFHTHIFPAKVSEKRESYFPKEPAFKILYDSSKSKLVNAETLIDVMDESRIDKSVIFGFPWKNDEFFRMHNDYIIASVLKYPDRFIGFACFDPFNDEAGNETARCIEAGLKGAGELAFYQSGIDEESLQKLKPVMAICRQKDFPVLIHTNEPIGHKYPGKTPNTLIQIYNMIKQFPDNKIVLAHWGGGIFLFNLLKKEVKKNLKNVYFDTAASPFLYDSDIYRYAKALAGADKILFGSDFPLLKPERYFKEIKSSGFVNEDVEKILGTNAATLLNL
ncbi:MAG: amidohydrolase family protein [Proteobacteria bacterium]|nr:amidohydrolase family protein [Pseudomonadota bacterium]